MLSIIKIFNFLVSGHLKGEKLVDIESVFFILSSKNGRLGRPRKPSAARASRLRRLRKDSLSDGKSPQN